MPSRSSPERVGPRAHLVGRSEERRRPARRGSARPTRQAGRRQGCRAGGTRRVRDRHDRLVAELSFGFWRYLLSSRYHASLWVPDLHRAFPRGPAELRSRRAGRRTDASIAPGSEPRRAPRTDPPAGPPPRPRRCARAARLDPPRRRRVGGGRDVAQRGPRRPTQRMRGRIAGARCTAAPPGAREHPCRDRACCSSAAAASSAPRASAKPSSRGTTSPCSTGARPTSGRSRMP